VNETIYKILASSLWARAEDEQRVPWAPIDVADGFVHLSAASQLRETARRHFAGQRELMLVGVDPARIPAGRLRWEPSRGGALFPHVYGDIPLEAVTRAMPLAEAGGELAFPAEIPPEQ
jgi:uncharacterized protein (DUF952 family)